MLKREIKLLITFLLLNTTISSAEVVSAYDLHTSSGKTQSYKTEELQKSLDKRKDINERTEIYKQFADDVSSANYLGVKDKDGNYVEYDKVVAEYKEGKAKIVASGGGIDMTNIINKHTKDFKNFGNKQNVDNKKSWKITFNHNVVRATMSGSNLKVVDSRRNDTDVICEPDNGNLKVWNIKPRTEWKSGESYAIVMKRGITTNLTSHRGLTKDVVLQFSVKGSSSEDSINQVLAKSEMLAILKDFSNGYYDDRVLTKEQSWAKEDSIEAGETKGEHLLKDYVRLKNFKEKYNNYKNNKKYDSLTDLEIYRKLSNLTVNFDKLNNTNNHGPYAQVSLMEPGNVIDKYKNIVKFPSAYLKYYEEYSDYKEGATTASVFVNFNKDIHHVIWRPEMEKEMIEEINKLRVSKGMKPLEVKNDLVAMSKFCAKRSHYEYTFGGTEYFQPNVDHTNSLTTKWLCGSIAGYKPFCTYEQTSENLTMRSEAGGKRDEFILNVTGDVSNVFGYKQPVDSLSGNSITFTTAKQYLDLWCSGENAVIDHQAFRDYSRPYNVKANILNPDMKYIGVGAIWEAPMSPIDMNGSLGLFCITSK